MPGTAEAPEPPKSSSFASLLAGFAALTDKTKTSGEGSSPKRKSTFWNDKALEDDVAVISYEQALRTHKRTRSYGSVDQPGLPPGLTPFSPFPDSPATVSPYDEFSASDRKPPVSAHRASLSPASVNPGSVGVREWKPKALRRLNRIRPHCALWLSRRKPEISQYHHPPQQPRVRPDPSARCSRRSHRLSLSSLLHLGSGKPARPGQRSTRAALLGHPFCHSQSCAISLKPVTSAAPHSRSWLFPRWNWMRRSLNA